MTTHTIKKGLDLRLAGKAEAVFADAPEPARVVFDTAEFPGIKPKVLVKEGDVVQIGTPLFTDKLDRDVLWRSPVSGKVGAMAFGERRFLLRLEVENGLAQGGKEEFAEVQKPPSDRDGILKALKGSGLWHLLVQRPFGRTPTGQHVPVAIYVNGMDSAPLAADPAFATADRKADLQAGVDLLKKLTSGAVYLTLRVAGDHQTNLRDLKGVEIHEFAGPHPSGLVGTHVSCIQPLKAGETCWALRATDVARIGEWARTGRFPAKVAVAVAGSAATSRKYFRVRQGAQVTVLNGGKPFAADARVIDGTVLHGNAIGSDGYLGFRAHTLTVIPEGEGRRDLFGWAMPGFGKLTNSRSVFGFFAPKQEYVVDARLHGGHRPIVNIGAYDAVLPLDIHTGYLMRAIQANDIDEAVKLGLLEVTEEDFALCTFVDPCKIDVGSVIRQGLDQYQKEN